MPHTSRKKRPRGPQKRLEITDDSGWTHITKATTSQRLRGSLLPGASIEHAFLSPPAGSNIEKVRVSFDGYLNAWGSSDCFRNLRRVLLQSVLSSRAVIIERCVCLGLGSFTAGMTVDASLWELAALVSVLDILSLLSLFCLHILFYRILEADHLRSNRVRHQAGLSTRSCVQSSGRRIPPEPRVCHPFNAASSFKDDFLNLPVRSPPGVACLH